MIIPTYLQKYELIGHRGENSLDAGWFDLWLKTWKEQLNGSVKENEDITPKTKPLKKSIS